MSAPLGIGTVERKVNDFLEIPLLLVPRNLAGQQRGPWSRLTSQLAASLFFRDLSSNTRVSVLET